MSTPNYDINYEDQRFTQVESEKTSALSDLEKTYTDMIDKSDSYYQSQIDASKEWADKQSQLQQEKTDFAIEQIEQQKAQAKKDYTKEQSGAYVDWQKQSNQYGVNAEQQAALGMQNSGYSESSQVSMYNTYQNRVATARESYNQAILNYNNSITEARLQNNSLLAEIAYNALQQQLELSLQGFQYKNQLILDKTAKRLEVDQMYYSRYQDVLQQINHENALAEQIRQYNESLAEEKRQHDENLAEEKRQFDRLYPEEEVATSSGGGGGGGYYSSGSSKKNYSSGSGSESSGGGSGGGAAVVKNNGGGSGGSSGKVDMQSVLDLGYGPISANTLNSLVNQGKVVEKTDSKGNKTFEKNNTGTTTSSNFLQKSIVSQQFSDYLAGKTNKTGKAGKNAASNTKREFR